VLALSGLHELLGRTGPERRPAGHLIAGSRPQALVLPPAEIDFGSAAGFAADISQAFATGATTVEVDFAAVTFCDSTGLQVLIHAAKLARALGGTFLIANPTQSLLRLADILQASDLLGLPPPD
jgi:anti-sigma B factor antagonist